MIVIGFTGTQRGMTDRQKSVLRGHLLHEREAAPVGTRFEFHHGDCVGADEQFDALVRELFPAARFHLHPCNIEGKRAHCETRPGDNKVHEVLNPITRNHVIVRLVDRLYACPKSAEPEIRSGTEATIRYAEKTGKPVTRIDP